MNMEKYTGDPLMHYVGGFVVIRQGGAYHVRARLVDLTYQHYVLDRIEHIESSGHWGEFLARKTTGNIDILSPEQVCIRARAPGDEVYPVAVVAS